MTELEKLFTETYGRKPKTQQELRVFKNYLALLGINVDGYQPPLGT